MTAWRDPRPLIAHVLFRFDVGGLENGVVNLINRLPESRWRHAVIALDDIAPAFVRRVERADVVYEALRKRPGYLFKDYPRLAALFRRLHPSVVHTRNLGALEAMPPAWFAGVPARVHGEHGWDVSDLDGANHRYRRWRRVFRPFVHRYIALSDQIASYLQDGVGVDATRVTRIYNGVDTVRFRPGGPGESRDLLPFRGEVRCVVGTVGRLQAVKDQVSLVRAFARLVNADGRARTDLRLVVVGEGPARPHLEEAIRSEGVTELAWLAGARDDVADLMRTFDVFVLPSLSEGISNTVLEAMASGLPVIATRVGGNAELVVDGETGGLTRPADVEGLAAAIGRYVDHRALALEHGAAARRRVEERFSLPGMVAAYDAVYGSVCPVAGLPAGSAPLRA